MIGAFVVLRDIIAGIVHVMSSCIVYKGISLWALSMSFTAISLGFYLFRYFFTIQKTGGDKT